MALNLPKSGTVASVQGCREKGRARAAQRKRGCRNSFQRTVSHETKVLEFEKRLISQALATANGRITHAAKWLDIGRQKLAYIIETRHPICSKSAVQCIAVQRKNTRQKN
jgi:DNA-binding NtrC family response regulator